MDEKLVIALEEIGLSKNEAMVYLTLLDTGSATATKIAESSKMHRTSVYDSLERLVKKGLVCYIMKGETKYFNAADPESLSGMLKQKEEDFMAILPQLKLSKELAPSKDKAKIYEGIAGIRSIVVDDIINSTPVGGKVVAFGLPKETPRLMSSFVNFYQKRRIEKKITMIHLYNENARERIKYLKSLPYTDAGYLPKEYDSPASTTVYGNKVAFYIWSDPPLGIVIESERMASAYKNYFELLWKLAIK
jgi:sugar-specific transcriptional regulator TrmB